MWEAAANETREKGAWVCVERAVRARHADTHGISDHRLMLSTVMRGNTMEIEKSEF